MADAIIWNCPIILMNIYDLHFKPQASTQLNTDSQGNYTIFNETELYMWNAQQYKVFTYFYSNNLHGHSYNRRAA